MRVKSIWWILLSVSILASGFGVWAIAKSPRNAAVFGAVTTYVLAFVWLTGQLIFLRRRSQQTNLRVALFPLPPGREEPTMLEISVENVSEHDVRLVTLGFQEPDGSNRVELGADAHTFVFADLLTRIPAKDARNAVVMIEDFKSLGFELARSVQAIVRTSTDVEFLSPSIVIRQKGTGE